MASGERTREVGPEESTAIFEQTFNGDWIADTTTTLSRSHSIMHDVCTVDYKKKIARGMIINNAMDYKVSDLSVKGSGSYTATGFGTVYTGSGGCQTEVFLGLDQGEDSLTDPEIDIDDLVAEAKFKALDQIDPTPYAFGEDLLEIGKTLRWIRNPASSIREVSLRLLRDRRIAENKFKDAKDLSLALSDLYLEARFALSPLVRSTIEAVDAYNVGTPSPRNKRRTSRGLTEGTDSVDLVEDVPIPGYGPENYDTYSNSQSMDVKVHAAILYEVSNPASAFQMQLGLRGSDIPETLWAVTPWSFLIDRVVDVSGAIRAVTNLLNPDIRIRAGSVSIRKKSISSISFIGETLTDWVVTVVPDTIQTETFEFDREIWWPELKDAIPKSDLQNIVSSATYIADLLALSASTLNRR